MRRETLLLIITTDNGQSKKIIPILKIHDQQNYAYQLLFLYKAKTII